MKNNQSVIASASPGEVITVDNHGGFTTTYRAEFPGVGWVEFDVLPHAKFRFLSHGGTVNLDIQQVTMAAGPRKPGDAPE